MACRHDRAPLRTETSCERWKTSFGYYSTAETAAAGGAAFVSGTVHGCCDVAVVVAFGEVVIGTSSSKSKSARSDISESSREPESSDSSSESSPNKLRVPGDLGAPSSKGDFAACKQSVPAEE
mmetsp:Transcript_76572/g.159311  ORF Transcript_76572/g.159311 Transcript_76572/m.159311 type:complete len:123 (-) Transcript_76572:618-986(-)